MKDAVSIPTHFLLAVIDLYEEVTCVKVKDCLHMYES